MHRTINPAILYFGTPVVLVSSLNEDGSPNLAPMSSAWWLGTRCLLGFGARSKTPQNIMRPGLCVLNLPSADLAGMVHGLALTGPRIRCPISSSAAVTVTNLTSSESPGLPVYNPKWVTHHVLSNVRFIWRLHCSTCIPSQRRMRIVVGASCVWRSKSSASTLKKAYFWRGIATGSIPTSGVLSS